jgi:hypothetical protein
MMSPDCLLSTAGLFAVFAPFACRVLPSIFNHDHQERETAVLSFPLGSLPIAFLY